MILNESPGSRGLGYKHETAWAHLRSVSLAEALITLTACDLDSYEWDTQSLTLSRSASRRLLAALPSAARREDGVEKLVALTEELGWGNEIERALKGRSFVVLLGEERLYGGIFLDPPSQMPIEFPVARCTRADGRIVFRLLPVHLPFFAVDPGVDQPAPTRDLLTREYGPVDKEVPTTMLDAFREDARSPHACAMRALIRDDRIRADLVRAGTLTEAKPAPPRP